MVFRRYSELVEDVPLVLKLNRGDEQIGNGLKSDVAEVTEVLKQKFFDLVESFELVILLHSAFGEFVGVLSDDFGELIFLK